jgi:hypothetical protein
MVGMKTKFRNKVQLSNSLRLKITRIDVDAIVVINSNRKQAHQSHTSHYEKEIETFCKIIFNNKYKYFFLFRTRFFLSSKAMWVAIDCRSKNWVAVLKSVGSTAI